MKQLLFKGAFALWSLSACFACQAGENALDAPATDKGGTTETKTTYANPVIDLSVPDPTAIRTADGTFYLYGTEDIRNLPIFKSQDLVKWKQCGTAFTDATRPQDVKDASLWAPEIRYIKGKYVLFYSLAKWGEEWVSTIGYAVADRPEGPFKPRGVVFSSRDVAVQNSIDEFFYEENGRYYMFWGSFRGIYMMELKVSDDLTITPMLETKQQVAGTAFEAVNIWKRNGWYYLFASVGTCCEGAKSTYTTVVGRSRALGGPYLDKTGKPMLDNGYTKVIERSSYFAGPGHNSILMEDDRQDTWMLYHAYKLYDVDDGRVVMLDRIQWDNDGWPYVEGGQPSTEAVKPYFKTKTNKK